MKINISKNSKGFTIIEVLIVLAIAGLIMLVVLLAVPGLQRSQANTAAKTDATHIAAALTNFIANNNGILPTGGAGGTLATVYTNIAGLSKLTDVGNAVNVPTYSGGLATTNTWYMNSNVSVQTAAQTSSVWAVIINTGALCPANGVTFAPTLQTTTTGASASSIVLLYTTAISGGVDWNCLQVQ
jgi:prepilin-type N-terminal cleavage/methylation domain-containing protein